MKIKIPIFHYFILCAVALPLGLIASTLPVTPQSLGNWTVTGADSSILAKAGSLTLPAGSQISHTFAAGDIGLDLNSRPVFGEKPADWPIIQVGPAAIAFVRVGSQGSLKLLLGAQSQLPLPYTFELDENGRAKDPIQLALVFSAAVVGVSAQDQTVTYPVSTPSGVSQEVVVAAGNANVLNISSLEIISEPAVESLKSSRDSVASVGTAASFSSTGVQKDSGGAVSKVLAGGAGKVLTVTKLAEGSKAPAAAVFMEIITPGAFRSHPGAGNPAAVTNTTKAQN